jgi:hypothetical protein
MLSFGRRSLGPSRPLVRRCTPRALCLILLLLGGCTSSAPPASVTSTGGSSVVVTATSSASPVTPLPTVAATAGVRSVCLVVEELYGAAPPLPIAETAASILEHIGLDVVVGQEVGCDAVLSVSLSLRPLGQEYEAIPFTGGHNCFAGAEATGEATLAIGAGQLLTLPIHEWVEPPSSVTDCPTMESEAPFGEVWPGPLTSLLGEWWGIPALVAAMEIGEAPMPGIAAEVMAGMWGEAGAEATTVLPLLLTMFASDDPGTFEGAALAIGAMGPAAAEALPVVLEALRSQDYQRRQAAIDALGAFGATAHDTGAPVPAEVLAALISTLEGDEVAGLRALAAQMLGGMGPDASSAIPALVAAVRTNYPTDWEVTVGDELGSVAKAAAQALLDVGPEGIPALIELLDDPVGVLAVSSLEIPGQTLGNDPDAWRRWLEALACSDAATSTEVTLNGQDLGWLAAGEEIGVVVEEARFIPSPILYTSEEFESEEVASGRFFAVRYTIQNGSSFPFWVLNTEWLLTDGRGAWAEDSSRASTGWSTLQGDQDPDPMSEVPPRSAATTWVVFDIPQAAVPTAIAWPFEGGNQACLSWP